MPTTAPEPLLSLIGLSAAGSACFPLPDVTTPDTNEGITASASGLYLDAVEGLLREPTQGRATPGEYYARLTKARQNAVDEVTGALLRRGGASIGVPRYTGQQGIIGGQGNGALLPAGTPARLTLYTAERRAGAWRVQSLQLFTDVPVIGAPVLLDGVPIGTVTTNGGAFVPLADATPAALVPLNGRTHTLEAVLPAGVRVKANTLYCNCNQIWGNYLRACLTNEGGGPVDVRGTGGGFAVTIREECTEPLDAVRYAVAQDAELARAVAHAIRYTAAALFVVDLITDSNRSRYTLLEPKLLPDMQKLYQDKAEQWLAWLAGPEGLGRVQHPCYQCQPPEWHPSKGKNY